ncbi:Hypothetical predicted protein, partial [Marmota monax]
KRKEEGQNFRIVCPVRERGIGPRRSPGRDRKYKPRSYRSTLSRGEKSQLR